MLVARVHARVHVGCAGRVGVLGVLGVATCRGVLDMQRSVVVNRVSVRVAAFVLGGPCRVGGAPVRYVSVLSLIHI